MKEKGLSARSVLKGVESRLRRDLTFESGRILGSMCTSPHQLAQQVYVKCMEKNLGDPGLFPATAALEEEVIKMLGSILSNPNAAGNLVTGGTEANVLALMAFRNLKRKGHGEIVVPVSAHCSFEKAANLLGLRIVRVRLNSDYRVDVDTVRRALTAKTVGIVGIAGTTGLGVVDPIEELSEVALEKGLFLHVDAAFGGFVLPFLKELGHRAPRFDFELPGVSSMTVDPHKMGLAPIPAGGIMFRNSELKKAIAWKVPYLAGGETEQTTFVGTRSGASVVATWALLTHLGREGYRKIVKRCMDLTSELTEEIKKIPRLDIMTEPTTNVVGIKSDFFNIERLASEIRKLGWAVSLFPQHIRIVVMPHIREEHLKSFLEDLRKVSSDLNSWKGTN